MGVITRKSGESYVITSDRVAGELLTSCAPKKRMSDVYQVWTGDAWSTTMTDAKTFKELDTADDYVRANYVQVMGQMKR